VAVLSVAAAACSTRMLAERDKFCHASFRTSRYFATVLKVLLYLAVLQPTGDMLRKLQ
jgi:hypothetical protein